MSTSNEVPPWLREQLVRFEQLQQNLQAIMLQKQQIDVESSELDRAITELKKAADSDAVYKSAGNILVRAKKDELLKDLEERKELAEYEINCSGKTRDQGSRKRQGPSGENRGRSKGKDYSHCSVELI